MSSVALPILLGSLKQKPVPTYLTPSPLPVSSQHPQHQCPESMSQPHQPDPHIQQPDDPWSALQVCARTLAHAFVDVQMFTKHATVLFPSCKYCMYVPVSCAPSPPLRSPRCLPPAFFGQFHMQPNFSSHHKRASTPPKVCLFAHTCTHTSTPTLHSGDCLRSFPSFC